MEGSPDEPAAASLSADCSAIACRAMDDMGILAHIREQHRLSLHSYGRPRMIEELQEIGLRVGAGLAPLGTAGLAAQCA